MSVKEVIKDFYKSDALLDSEILKKHLHTDVLLDWNSDQGFLQFNLDSFLDYSREMNRAYVRSKVRISHMLEENGNVFVRYSHFVKTIENPREEMLLGHFMVLWEVKENKLFRGYLMSQMQ